MADTKQKQKKTKARIAAAISKAKRDTSLKKALPAVRGREGLKSGGKAELPTPPPLKQLVPLAGFKDASSQSSILDNVWEGIKTGWNALTSALGSLANSVGGLFSGSNTPTGNAAIPPTASNAISQPVGITAPPTSNTPTYSLPPVMDSQAPSASSSQASSVVSSSSSSPTSIQPSATNAANTNPSPAPVGSAAPPVSNSSQPTANTAQPSPATSGQVSSANPNAPSPPVSSQPYSATSSQTAPINANSPTPGVTTNPTQSMNTNTSFTQSGNQTYPASGNQQQPSSGMPTTTSARSKKSPNFWDRLNAFANALGDIASAPVKAISGHTSSPQLPATMDEYYARKQATEQTVYGNISDDNNPYGGIDYVHIPYLSQEEIIASEDLAADVGRNVENLVPIIESKLRRLNPYASDEDIRNRIVNALGPIYTLMLTHAQNQRQRYELLKAVENGQTSNFTPEQLQQLQQLGLIDQNGQLIPGAHAAAQASLSATFDDDKNQYPTVFTIASSAKPSEYNRQAIADRSARTGIFDTSVFGPEYTPMYGAMPPPPVAGVKAHISRQGSMSAGLSQPQQINISSPHPPSGGSKKTTLSVPPVKVNFSITNDRAQTDLNPNQMSAGEQSPILISAGLVHRKKNVLPDILFGSWEFTHRANSMIPYTKQDIQNIATRISENKYKKLQSVEADLDILSKFVGANGWTDLRNKLINADFAININAINNLSNFLTQSLSGSSSLSTDERILMELRDELADVFKDPSQAATEFQNYFTKLRTEATHNDKRAAKALYKLIMIAGYDNGFSNVLISDSGALAMLGLKDFQQANARIASSTKSAWANIFNPNTIQYLYDPQNQWSINYGGVHARDVALGVIANAVMRWYEQLPNVPPPKVK